MLSGMTRVPLLCCNRSESIVNMYQLACKRSPVRRINTVGRVDLEFVPALSWMPFCSGTSRFLEAPPARAVDSAREPAESRLRDSTAAQVGCPRGAFAQLPIRVNTAK